MAVFISQIDERNPNWIRQIASKHPYFPTSMPTKFGTNNKDRQENYFFKNDWENSQFSIAS